MKTIIKYATRQTLENLRKGFLEALAIERRDGGADSPAVAALGNIINDLDVEMNRIDADNNAKFHPYRFR